VSVFDDPLKARGEAREVSLRLPPLGVRRVDLAGGKLKLPFLERKSPAKKTKENTRKKGFWEKRQDEGVGKNSKNRKKMGSVSKFFPGRGEWTQPDRRFPGTW